MSIRPVLSETLAQPTFEGAGVHLHRAFGFSNPEEFDPFLMFDDFRNNDPRDYMRGFPWHPHRGIETMTFNEFVPVRPRFGNVAFSNPTACN